MNVWGSFVLQAIPATGLIVAGRMRRTGWLICLAGQLFAVVYGWWTGQLGFIFWAPIYITIYMVNWLGWNRRETTDETDSDL